MKENQIISIYCLNPKKVIGVATLGYHTFFPGEKGWIENVVVDYEFRDKGVGNSLIKHLSEKVKNINPTKYSHYREAWQRGT